MAGASFALLLACGADSGRANDTAPDDAVPPPPYTEATLPTDSPPSAGRPGAGDAAERPARKRAVVMIEGMADTVELSLVTAPEDSPLQFSTYAPPDMEVATDVVDGARSIRFVANFGGVRNERAYVQFHFYPRGTTRAIARNAVAGFLSGLNPVVDRTTEVEPYPWAIEQTRFRYPHEGQTFVGSVALAERGDILFHYVQHYPDEYGDGMPGRIRTIMEEWRWQDGTPLIR